MNRSLSDPRPRRAVRPRRGPPTASAGRRHRREEVRRLRWADDGRMPSRAAQGHTSGSSGPTSPRRGAGPAGEADAPVQVRRIRACGMQAPSGITTRIVLHLPMPWDHVERAEVLPTVEPMRSGRDGAQAGRRPCTNCSGAPDLEHVVRKPPPIRSGHATADSRQYVRATRIGGHRGVRPARTSPEVSGRGARASPSQVSILVDQMRHLPKQLDVVA